MVAGALSIFPFNGKQETTQKSTYKKEIVSEINKTEEIPEFTFLISLRPIKQHQQKDPSILDKYEEVIYQKVFLVEGVIYILTL